MLLNALLLSLIYLVSRTDMINGYMMLTKPIVLGPLVGLVLGDLQAGILIGATLELAFIGVMNIGISVSMDVSIATIVGGGLAILSGQDAAFALTIAIPTGILFNMLKPSSASSCSTGSSRCRKPAKSAITRRWNGITG